MRQRVRDVGHQRRGLRPDAAALQTESAVDAVRPLPESAVGDRHRADAGSDAQAAGAAQEDLAVAPDRVRAHRVAVRLAPGPVLPSDRQLLFQRSVIAANVVIVDGPIGADAVARGGAEVAGVEARRVAGVVHHRSADASAGVVRSQWHRVAAADHPGIGPVQVMRSGLVGHPVPLWIPERPGFQCGDAPAGPRQSLQEHRSAGPAADDDHVDLVPVVEPAHVVDQRRRHAVATVREQPGRFVAVTDRRHGWIPPCGCAPSCGPASATSNRSRLPTPSAA